MHLTGESLENFVGEEAPEARAGPRSPDAFYRGEEAGAVPKSTDIMNGALNLRDRLSLRLIG